MTPIFSSSSQRKLGSIGVPEEKVSRVNRQPCVYIMASARNGTLYVGVTGDVVRRVWQHKNNLVDGFTKRYRVRMLVYVEAHETMEAAIIREKQVKAWKRGWKLELIENANPLWRDLYDDLVPIVPK